VCSELFCARKVVPTRMHRCLPHRMSRHGSRSWDNIELEPGWLRDGEMPTADWPPATHACIGLVPQKGIVA